MLKTSKCSFGFKEVEFVGKVVSEAGLKVSQQKIQAVLDLPLPTVGKQLKSFLGTKRFCQKSFYDCKTFTWFDC